MKRLSAKQVFVALAIIGAAAVALPLQGPATGAGPRRVFFSTSKTEDPGEFITLAEATRGVKLLISEVSVTAEGSSTDNHGGTLEAQTIEVSDIGQNACPENYGGLSVFQSELRRIN